jgi:hypothetical protein
MVVIDQSPPTPVPPNYGPFLAWHVLESHHMDRAYLYLMRMGDARFLLVLRSSNRTKHVPPTLLSGGARQARACGVSTYACMRGIDWRGRLH